MKLRGKELIVSSGKYLIVKPEGQQEPTPPPCAAPPVPVPPDQRTLELQDTLRKINQRNREFWGQEAQ